MKKTLTLISLLTLIGILLTACGGASSLAGTTWKLVSYGPADNPTPAVPDVETNLTFGEDGKINGNVGCNSMFGDYKVNGEQIELGALGSTMMACDEPRMQQEAGVFFVLGGTVNFKLDGDTLTITSTDGASALVFKK